MVFVAVMGSVRERTREIGVLRVILFLCAGLSLSAGPSMAEEAPRSASFYTEAALANNPSLSAMQERIRMKENAAIRAGALDDPKGWFGLVNIPVNSWSFRDEDMTGKEIGVSCRHPYPGKRELRAEGAQGGEEHTEVA